MPIRPENRAKYPADWKAISHRIRFERADGKCEGSPAYPECRAAHGEPHPVTGSRVVLTVGHLDHDPSHNDPRNLAAWCQRCHLTYDAQHHARNAAATRLGKRAEREPLLFPLESEANAVRGMTKQTMPAHSEDVERYTPRHIFEGLGVTFGLDPCAPAGPCPSKEFCARFYSAELGQDGLELPWRHLAFLNPPWTRGEKRKWVMRLKEHGNGIALVRGGVDSAWLHDSSPDALFLLRGRVKYLRPDANPERPRKGGAVGGFEPSMLLAFGARAVEVLANAKLEGMFFQSAAQTQPFEVPA